MFIIFLSWFFLWEKESCDEDKGIIGRQLSDTCAYRAFSEDIHQMITDGAHVIRPTFYNYFQDKYEVIEFLFDRDIGSKVEVMIENDMEQEAIKLMFICFEKIRNITADFLRSQVRTASENFLPITVKRLFSVFSPDIP